MIIRFYVRILFRYFLLLLPSYSNQRTQVAKPKFGLREFVFFKLLLPIYSFTTTKIGQFHFRSRHCPFKSEDQIKGTWKVQFVFWSLVLSSESSCFASFNMCTFNLKLFTKINVAKLFQQVYLIPPSRVFQDFYTLRKTVLCRHMRTQFVPSWAQNHECPHAWKVFDSPLLMLCDVVLDHYSIHGVLGFLMEIFK